LEEVSNPYALSRICVVGSTVVVSAVLDVDSVSRSSTHCTVCAAAFSALVTAADGALFRSLCTVANACCAVVRSPPLSALPSVARSVASCELAVVLVPVARPHSSDSDSSSDRC
jgi:hypothetical protein